MSTTTPTIEPDKFTAGDTVNWNKTLSDYPASTHVLTYYLHPISGTGNVINITASANGNTHEVRITPATSQNYNQGDYRWHSTVTDNTNTYAVDTGLLTINPNFRTTTALDDRSHAERTLAYIESTIEKLSQKVISSASVNGKSYTLANISDLMRLRDNYFYEVDAEKRKAKLNRGNRDPHNYRVRFR